MRPETRESLESIALRTGMDYWQVYSKWLSYLTYTRHQGVRATLRDFEATLTTCRS